MTKQTLGRIIEQDPDFPVEIRRSVIFPDELELYVYGRCIDLGSYKTIYPRYYFIINELEEGITYPNFRWKTFKN